MAVLALTAGCIKWSGPQLATLVVPRAGAGSLARRAAIALAGIIGAPPQPSHAETAAPDANALKGSRPAWAEELKPYMPAPGPVASLFSGDAPQKPSPRIAWRPLGPQTSPFGDGLLYPDWLSGTWDVSYSNSEVFFPHGWGVLTPKVPGVARASIVRLPDVGATVSARWRFLPAAGGKQQVDWAFTLRSLLLSFYPGAAFAEEPTRTPATKIGQRADGWRQAARLPQRTDTVPVDRAQRNSTLTWLAGDVADDGQDGCFSIEWLRQFADTSASDSVADYKVLQYFRRLDDGSVQGFQRVAAFLQPVDENYMEAEGEAVALYDYRLSLRRAASESTER